MMPTDRAPSIAYIDLAFLLSHVSELPFKGPRGKPATRRTLLSRRDALTAAERSLASYQIAVNAATLLEQETFAGNVIALYAAKGSEVATSAIDAACRERGLRVVYPRLVEGKRELSFHEVMVGELEPSRFGLQEPVATSARVAIEDIAAFVVPGVAFDRKGSRLGWGRGHYDATLEAVPASLRIGLAFECQIVEDEIVREPHDVAVHFIITEVATHEVV